MATLDHFVVVVGIDFSEPGDQALDRALESASLRRGGEVHVLYVEPEDWLRRAAGRSSATEPDAATALGRVEEHVAERLEQMRARTRLGRLERVIAHFRHGSPSESITQLADDLDADLVVVGSNGHRGYGIHLGSVAEHVSRLVRCPVWIVRPKNHSTARHPASIEPPCPASAKGDTSEARDGEPRSRPRRYAYASNGICTAEATVYEAAPPA